MNNKPLNKLQQDSIELLKQLIAIPSFSKEEDKTAVLLLRFLEDREVSGKRHLNNIWARNKYYSESKPTILLNSHHDTVKPNKGYTRDPFLPIEEVGKLYGLGSNDAGGSLVSLIAAFLHFHDLENLNYNLIIAATAEEEISGHNGIEALLPMLGNIDSAIVGEPTQMQMAVAERGLVVLDCLAEGKAGHAARDEGENAIYKAMMDIEWIYVYRFPKVSDLLGPVKMTVTSIETDNKAHNVVPAFCSFLVDVRVNELYTLEEVVETIKDNVQSKVNIRSLRMRASSIPLEHPLVQSGLSLKRTYYGSPTTSDKALMPFPALKMGPGDSARSHTADEFIYLEEIREGIDLYIKLLNRLMK
jgi:acetylornithine deacetylase